MAEDCNKEGCMCQGGVVPPATGGLLPKYQAPNIAIQYMNLLNRRTVKFKRMEGNDLPLPAYETEQSAGFDCRACIPEGEVIRIIPGGRELVPLGFAVALPVGTELQLRPRSGLAIKNGVTICNSPGTIDADYRGEVKAIIINHGDTPFIIRRGDRICQGVITDHERAVFTEVETLDETERGAGGFGSTGVA